MSRNNSMGSLPLNQGFTVFQFALGAPLQFLPALGTPELDTMIDAYVPGPASISEKRRAVSMEFFSYSQQTGETSLFFPVLSLTPVTTDSPASSLTDSGYGSGFNVSPVVPEMWGTPVSVTTPPSPSSVFAALPTAETRFTKPKVSTKSSGKNSTATATSSSSSSATSVARIPVPDDFSHLPCMRVFTKDGVDVTNSTSRGSKTKEQRDHAHLMRIIKACDSCRRKKVRCDPSHKKRDASQLQSSPATEPKQAKKVKTSPPLAPATPPPKDAALLAVQTSSFQMAPMDPSLFEAALAELSDETFNWEQFINCEDEKLALPEDYDFCFDSPHLFTYQTGLSVSSTHAFTPSSAANCFAPSLAGTPGVDLSASSLATSEDDASQPQLPYLSSEGPGGSNYLDFTLFSPASSFLDEEPQQLQTSGPTRPSNQQFFGQSSWSPLPLYNNSQGGRSPTSTTDDIFSTRGHFESHGSPYIDALTSEKAIGVGGEPRYRRPSSRSRVICGGSPDDGSNILNFTSAVGRAEGSPADISSGSNVASHTEPCAESSRSKTSGVTARVATPLSVRAAAAVVSADLRRRIKDSVPVVHFAAVSGLPDATEHRYRPDEVMGSSEVMMTHVATPAPVTTDLIAEAAISSWFESGDITKSTRIESSSDESSSVLTAKIFAGMSWIIQELACLAYVGPKHAPPAKHAPQQHAPPAKHVLKKHAPHQHQHFDNVPDPVMLFTPATPAPETAAVWTTTILPVRQVQKCLTQTATSTTMLTLLVALGLVSLLAASICYVFQGPFSLQGTVNFLPILLLSSASSMLRWARSSSTSSSSTSSSQKPDGPLDKISDAWSLVSRQISRRLGRRSAVITA